MEEIDCEDCGSEGRYLSHAGGTIVDSGECKNCHGKGVIEPPGTAIIPIEFRIDYDRLYACTKLGTAEKDGAIISILLALNGAIVVTVKKEGTTVDYQLTPDALGNAVYREWKKTYGK